MTAPEGYEKCTIQAAGFRPSEAITLGDDKPEMGVSLMVTVNDQDHYAHVTPTAASAMLQQLALAALECGGEYALAICRTMMSLAERAVSQSVRNAGKEQT